MGRLKKRSKTIVVSNQEANEPVVLLADWQIASRDNNIVRVGNIYQKLAAELFESGKKERAAEFFLKSAECYQKATVELAEWQITTRHNNIVRVGNIYQKLAAELFENGESERSAEFFLKSAECYQKATVELTEWQKIARNNNIVRVGNIYQKLAAELFESGDSERSAEFFLKSAECYQKATVELTEWQKIVRDNNIVRVGNIYQQLANKLFSNGELEKAAEIFVKSAECFQQACPASKSAKPAS